MYIKTQIQKFVFINIETVSGEKTLIDLKKTDPKLGELWEAKSSFLKKDKLLETEESFISLYDEKSALYPEFNKIISISFGALKEDNSISIRNFTGEDEKEIIQKSLKLIDMISSKTGLIHFKLIGHGIKKFGLPTLCKRAIINKIDIPDILQIHKLKPWDYPIIDTQEVWSFGNYQESFTSLELLCHSLEIPYGNKKLSIDELKKLFYDTKDYETITEYSNTKVAAIINCLLRFGNNELITNISSK